MGKTLNCDDNPVDVAGDIAVGSALRGGVGRESVLMSDRRHLCHNSKK